MAAHTYWRLAFAAIDGGTVLTIAEIELRTSVGGANAATGGTATADVGTAANAFDASNSTNWAATGQTYGWIKYQFASPADIVEHAVTSPSATDTNAPKQWSIQWSDDNSNWTTAALVNGQTAWGVSEKRVFTHSSWPLTLGFNPDTTDGLMVATGLMPVGGIDNKSNPSRNLQAYSLNGQYFNKDAYISGTVKENGTPAVRMVRAYDRVSGALIGEVNSAADGTFSILALQYRGQCYVIAFDNLTLAPDYNAKIFDLVIPV